MNILHELIVIIVPYMISILEIIGILIVFGSGIYAFCKFLMNMFTKKDFDLKNLLGRGLAMGLEFKMAAEILRTVLVQSMDELYMLGAIILLRTLLSLLIHYEIKSPKKKKQSKDKE